MRRGLRGPGALLFAGAIFSAGCASQGASNQSDAWSRAIFESEASEPSRRVHCPPSRTPGFFNPRALVVTVHLWIVVAEDGSVADARSPEIEPADRQDIGNLYVGSALKLARECLFEPATLDGMPVSVRKQVLFSFEHYS